MTKRERRTFTKEFKHQMVQLYLNGKPRKDIIREYSLTPSTLDKWISQNQTTGSFNEKDNRTLEETELMKLRKENKQLLMENDILSAGPNKDALLVYRVLPSIKKDLNQIQLFHTDRGNEFKNKIIDEALETFNIKRSLSMKGCPYDNAVAEILFSEEAVFLYFL